MKILLSFALIALLPLAHAQEAPTIKIRTLCFERDPSGIDKLVVFKEDKSTVKLIFPESFPSQPEKVPVVNGSVFFHNPAQLDAPPIAIAKIPAGIKEALIIFFPSTGTEPTTVYDTVVINASLKGIPEDGALIMNIYSHDVRVVVGEHRILLPPGKSTGVARPKERNDYNMAAVVFQTEINGQWTTIAETAIHFPPDQQQFFLTYPDARTKSLALRTYQIDTF